MFFSHERRSLHHPNARLCRPQGGNHRLRHLLHGPLGGGGLRQGDLKDRRRRRLRRLRNRTGRILQRARLNLGSLYIGTSGFSHDAWAQGLFYPKDLSRKEWFPFYASRFNSVELNLTFQKVPEKEVFVEWQSQVSQDFKFSLKGFQYITHVKKLTGVSEPLRLFMDRVLKLKGNLACLFWEIPVLGPDRRKLFEGFLNHLKKYPQARHVFEWKDPSPLPSELT